MSSSEPEIAETEPDSRGSSPMPDFFGPNSQPSPIFQQIADYLERQHASGEFARLTDHEWRPGRFQPWPEDDY